MSSLGFTPAFGSAQDSSQVFIENKGQWDLQARLLAQTGGHNLWLTEDGAVMDFHQTTSNKYLKGDVVKMSFVNSDPAEASGVQQLGGHLNYYYGKDSSRWVTNARRFAEAKTSELYKGISARYYFSQGMPRFDLVLQPSADPSQIAMRYEGAQGLQVLPNGNLRIHTSLGDVEEQGLYAYQARGGTKSKVECKMVTDGQTVHFQFGSYDKSRELVIDPLVYSTFFGVAPNTNIALALGPSNEPVIVSATQSASFPTTVGAYQTAAPTYQDATISKLSADGSQLLYSTFLGGGGSQEARCVVVDKLGNIVVAGDTSSYTFPTTAGAYKQVFNGFSDFFVAKFGPTGNLMFSTLIADGEDTPTGIALDSAGNYVVVGYGQDQLWPVTAGAFQGKTNMSAEDGLLCKLSSDGTKILAASYLGGVTYSVGDYIQGLVLDSSDNVFITGYTWSSDFPVTTGAYQSKFMSVNDAIVVKMNPTFTTEIFGTFLAGSQGSSASSIVLDAAGNPVIGGTASAGTFPTTAGAYQTITGALGAAFVAKISSTGSTLMASSLIAGINEDYAYAVAVDPSGSLIISGQAQSSNFPTTAGAYQPTNQGGYDGFISKFSADCKTLQYSSFLGGSNDESIQSMTLDSAGIPVLVGWTGSSDFPISANPYQKALAVGNSMFITKLQIGTGSTQSVSLALNPATVTGGVLSYGTVTLLPVAPAGGASVAITSGTSALGTLPLAAGASQAAFSLTTNPVDATDVVPITVSYAGGSQTQNLTIVPPVVSTLTLSASSVSGGTGVTGTVTLNGGAGPSGVKVFLSSSNTVAATVAANVALASGVKTITFPVTTKAVTTNTAVTITASFGGVSKTASLTVVAGPTALGSLQLNVSSAAAGLSVIGTANLTGKAPTGGTVVSLKSSNITAATVPASVTVAAGATSQAFYVTALSVSANTSVTITATSGTVSKTAVVTVTPAAVSSVKLNVASIVGGTKVGGAAYLSGHAGSLPIVISLKSSNTAVGTVPASVTVAANAPGQYLMVTTLTVTAQSVVTITATTGTVSKSATLTVTPSISSVHLNATSITGGTKVGGAAYLSGHVGTVPVVIALKSSNPAVATVPASVTAPTGGLGQYFTVTTLGVKVDTVVTITATTGGVSKGMTITVKAP